MLSSPQCYNVADKRFTHHDASPVNSIIFVARIGSCDLSEDEKLVVSMWEYPSSGEAGIAEVGPEAGSLRSLSVIGLSAKKSIPERSDLRVSKNQKLLQGCN
jgi:hypothetical protein